MRGSVNNNNYASTLNTSISARRTKCKLSKRKCRLHRFVFEIPFNLLEVYTIIKTPQEVLKVSVLLSKKPQLTLNS